MQTMVSLVLMLSGAFTAYGYASGNSNYLFGGLMLSAVLLVMSLVDDVQTHERKKVN